MKHAIITGAGAGIGAAIAKRFADGGFRVGVLDVDAAKAQRVASELTNAVALSADVTNEASVEQAFEQFGAAPDVVVNNAGTLRTGPLLEQSTADFRTVIDVNLIGPFLVARAAARRMAGAAGGSIINLSSINGVHPSTNCGAYAASKGAVITLTQQMSLEWGQFGIRVNSIAPGFIDAGMSTPFYENSRIRELRSNATPLKRLGLAEDIAEAAWFLGTDSASFITGQNLTVDGGVINSVLLQLPRA